MIKMTPCLELCSRNALFPWFTPSFPKLHWRTGDAIASADKGAGMDLGQPPTFSSGPRGLPSQVFEAVIHQGERRLLNSRQAASARHQSRRRSRCPEEAPRVPGTGPGVGGGRGSRGSGWGGGGREHVVWGVLNHHSPRWKSSSGTGRISS